MTAAKITAATTSDSLNPIERRKGTAEDMVYEGPVCSSNIIPHQSLGAVNRAGENVLHARDLRDLVNG
jgi:hypothetical protein